MVTSGDGVGMCMDSNGDELPSGPTAVDVGFTLEVVLDFEAVDKTTPEDGTGGVCADVTTGVTLVDSVLSKDG